MNNPKEQQQTRLMTIVANYKTTNNRLKTLPKISISFCIAIFSFIASVLSLVFGCLCWSNSKVINYVITGTIILLFLAVLLLQLLDNTHAFNKRRDRELERAEQGASIKNKNVIFKYTLQRRIMRRTLIQQLNEKAADNEYTGVYDNMSEEELLDEYINVFDIEASITVYKKHLAVLNQLIEANEKHEKMKTWILWAFSCAAILGSIVYYILINCFY